jgi:hypothetical protein
MAQKAQSCPRNPSEILVSGELFLLIMDGILVPNEIQSQSIMGVPMAKKSSKAVAKEKISELPDPRTARAARIKRGQAILDAVKDKAKGVSEKRRTLSTMLQEPREITEATRKKYISNEIELAAKRDERSYDDVAVDVDLALLVRRAESFSDSRLKEALNSGLMPLTWDTILALLNTPSGKCEAAFSKLLSEQV